MAKKVLIVGLCNAATGVDLALSINFEMPAGDVPASLMLLPGDEEIKGIDGRQWTNPDPAAIVAAFNAEGRDIVFDIEHATEIRAPKGEPAPAAGWVRNLRLVDRAVWADVEWTPAARNAIASREYRYYSPAFLYDKKSGRIHKISSLGLTNKPNLNVPALNHQQEENTMFKKLLALLGLEETATEETACNAVKKMQGELQTALNRATTPDLALFVPRADYDAVLNRAAAAEQKIADAAAAALEAEITREVEAACKAGKITPATRDYYTAMCRQKDGLEAFKKFVAAAPIVGDASGLSDKKPATGTALNAAELEALENLGISVEDYQKFNPAQ